MKVKKDSHANIFLLEVKATLVKKKKKTLTFVIFDL